MKVYITSRAKKELGHLPTIDQIAADRKIRALQNDEQIDEEKLAGYKKAYRARVGNYRIVYKKEKKEITIILIHHRKDVYETLKKLLG